MRIKSVAKMISVALFLMLSNYNIAYGEKDIAYSSTDMERNSMGGIQELNSEKPENAIADTEHVSQKNELLINYNTVNTREWKDLTVPQMIIVDTTTGIQRIEILYTGEGTAPSLTLVSPSGTIYTKDGAPVPAKKAVIRTNFKVKKYPEFHYIVLYITNEEQGKWNISISADAETDSLIVVSTEVAENWKNLPKENLQYPENLILWHFKENSIYTIESIKDITATEPHNTSQMQSVVVEEGPKDLNNNPYEQIIIWTVVLGLLAIIIFSCIGKKMKKKAKEKSRNKRLEEANRLLEEKKKKENEELDVYMRKFDGEYIDYKEDTDYTKWEPQVRAFSSTQETFPYIEPGDSEDAIDEQAHNSTENDTNDDNDFKAYF